MKGYKIVKRKFSTAVWPLLAAAAILCAVAPAKAQQKQPNIVFMLMLSLLSASTPSAGAWTHAPQQPSRAQSDPLTTGLGQTRPSWRKRESHFCPLCPQ
jgi:hypothetical protein